MCRYVLSPTAAVQMAVLSQLRGLGGDSSAAHAAAAAAGTTAAAQPGETGTSKGLSAATTGSNSSLSRGTASSATKVPFAYSLQLFDTAGAKEVTWGAAYKLVAEAAGGTDGRALLPAVQLQPGKYLVALQLQPGACQQWVDPVTGATEPAPGWQLALLPSADEKVRRQSLPYFAVEEVPAKPCCGLFVVLGAVPCKLLHVCMLVCSDATTHTMHLLMLHKLSKLGSADVLCSTVVWPGVPHRQGRCI